jgi:uncharacterized membrane protein required for colicin V production
MFSLIDLVLVLIVGMFVFFGLFFGLIHTLGSVVGTILGVVLGTRLIDPVFDKFGFLFGGGGAGKVILFIILFLLISRLVGLGFWMIEKVFGLLAWFPFASTINRLLGGLLGFVEGVLVVGVCLFFAMQYLPDTAVKAGLEASFIAKYLLALAAAIQVLFPEGVRITMSKLTRYVG